MVRVQIMCVPERHQFVLDTYPAELLDGAHLYIDRDHRGAWPPMREAFDDAISEGPDYVLSLQDDLTFCDDFVWAVDHIATLNHGRAMSLFSPYGKLPKMAFEAGDKWFGRRDPLWAQALLLPIEHVAGIMAFAESLTHVDDAHDDVRIGAFYGAVGIPLWYAVPSLVQHEGASQSVLGQSNSRRVADYYIGAESPKGLDWTIYGTETVGQVGDWKRWLQ